VKGFLWPDGSRLRARKLHIVLFAVVLSGLAVAACAPPTTDEDSGQEGEGPIVVASAMPLTGPFASDGEEMEQGLKMAIDEYNDKGGLLGRKLTLATCDVGALEVDTIQACGERLLGENPDAIITGYDDSGVNTLAFGPGDMPYLHAVTMRAAVKPVMDDPEEFGNVFQYDPSDYDYGVDAARNLPKIAQDIGFNPTNKSVAVITTDYAYNVVGAKAFETTIQEQGYEVAVHEVTPFGVQEWGPILTKIEQAEPAFTTFWNLDPADAARFITQFRRHFSDTGFNTLVYMQYTPNIPEFLELAADDAEGVLWSTVLGVTDEVGRASGEYVQAFQERYGHEPKSIHPYVVRDAFDIWAGAVRKAGCVECYDKVIEEIRNTVYKGYAGVYKFAPLEEGQFAMPGPDLLPTIWSQVQNGRHVQVLPEVVADGEIQMPPWIPK
jgi:branched-chain amino acid transport system substrate-binding protein